MEVTPKRATTGHRYEVLVATEVSMESRIAARWAPLGLCPRGHRKGPNHISTVLLNLKTLSSDYDEAAAAGYFVDRRWDGRERRRS